MAEPFRRQLRAALLRTSPGLRPKSAVEMVDRFGQQLRAALLRTSPSLTGGADSAASRRPSVRWLADFPLPAFSGVRAADSGWQGTEVILPARVAAELGTARVVTVTIEAGNVGILVQKIAAGTTGVEWRLYVGLDGPDQRGVSVALTDKGGWLRGDATWTGSGLPTVLRLGRQD